VLVAIAGAAVLARPGAPRAQYLESYFTRGVPGYDQERGVTVLTRLRPLYEQPGIRLGSFMVRPHLDEAFGYDSNAAGLSSSPGSWVLRTSPALSVNSGWSRNSLGVDLSLDNYQYWNTPRQSHTDWTAAIGGGYTIGRSNLTLAYSHLSLHQSAGDVGAVPADQPVPYQVDDLRSAYTFDLGRLSFTPNIDVRAYQFADAIILGVPTSQEYRNRIVFSGGVTTRYELSDLRNLVFVVQGVDSHYTNPQLGQPTYNSKSFLALGGLDYQASGVWRYQILIGVEYRHFQSPQFSDRTAPIAEASAIWTPTNLTTVTGILSRTIEDTAAQGSAGYTYSTARVIVDHEYRRNIMWQGRAMTQVAEYLQGGTQTNFSVGTGVTWLINRNLRLSVDYDFTTQSGSNSATFIQPNLTAINTGGYDRHLFLVTMRFAL